MSAVTFDSRPSWIISRRDDLLFFSGSALLGYAFLVPALFLGHLPAIAFACYGLLLDGPHIYSTATRALLDPAERKRVRLLWLIAGPLCAVIAYALVTIFGNVSYLAVVALTNYHITKQHMGFVMIYKRKAGERGDYKADKYFAILSLMLPFFFFASAFKFEMKLLPGFLVIAIALIGWYAWRQSRKQFVNRPKLLLLFAFIPLHWFAWVFAAAKPSVTRLAVVAVVITAGHGLQYLRLVYFHNNNRYRTTPGILGKISKRWIFFMAAIMLLSFPVAMNISHAVNNKVLGVFLLAALFFHFVLDTKIWRLRGDPDLAHALKL